MELTRPILERLIREYSRFRGPFFKKLLQDLGLNKIEKEIGEEGALEIVGRLLGKSQKSRQKKDAFEARRRLAVAFENEQNSLMELYNEVREKVILNL